MFPFIDQTSLILDQLLSKLSDAANVAQNGTQNETTLNSHGVLPKKNVIETSTGIEIQMALPGVKKEQVSLNITNQNEVVVEYTKQESKEDATDDANEDKAKFISREFLIDEFRQVIKINEHYNREKVTATMEDGLLTISIPRITVEEKKASMQNITIE